MSNKIIVTIQGAAGVGKTTIADLLEFAIEDVATAYGDEYSVLVTNHDPDRDPASSIVDRVQALHDLGIEVEIHVVNVNNPGIASGAAVLPGDPDNDYDRAMKALK